MIFNSDSATIITHHIFETLYTFNSKWEPSPVLASAMPTVSENGTVVTIPLRTDAVFHNGRPMTAEDVAASLNRWARVSPRGKLVGAQATSIAVKGADAIEIRLKQLRTGEWQARYIGGKVETIDLIDEIERLRAQLRCAGMAEP